MFHISVSHVFLWLTLHPRITIPGAQGPGGVGGSRDGPNRGFLKMGMGQNPGT